MLLDSTFVHDLVRNEETAVAKLDDLVERCLAGDQSAWEVIVGLHWRRVFNIAYKFVGTHDEAERIEVWFQDEARVGQKGRMVRRWFQRGMRPRMVKDQRYRSAIVERGLLYLDAPISGGAARVWRIRAGFGQLSLPLPAGCRPAALWPAKVRPRWRSLWSAAVWGGPWCRISSGSRW